MYSSVARIKARVPEQKLIELTDDEQQGVVNDTRITAALTKASSIADSYCGTKYSVPFAAPVPAIVEDLVDDIAEYELYARKVSEFPPAVEKRRDDAVNFFKSVSNGTASLGINPAPTATSEGGAETNKTASDRVFTRDTLSGF